MDARDIDSLLEDAFAEVVGPAAPPRLHAAMRAAVFGGGGRLRPRIVLAVADACGGVDDDVAARAAAAIEFLHCASLVHDDLPCFDDAAIRRGRPSVHAQFGVPLAVLAGDGLITAAFELLSRVPATPKLPGLLSMIARSVGASRGIVAGQAWESEPAPNLRLYHRAKTGALFEAAFGAGALVGGGDVSRWRALGTRLGEAYQIADDLADRLGTEDALGKPTGQDNRLDRPNAVRELGTFAAKDRLRQLVASLLDDVPDAPRRERFVRWLEAVCSRVLAPTDVPAVAAASNDRGDAPLVSAAAVLAI